jgi:Alr-MurF fusion protein
LNNFSFYLLNLPNLFILYPQYGTRCNSQNHMPFYKLQKISEIVDGTLTGTSDIEILHLLTDSRKVVYPSGSLFFAIKGLNHDGTKYIPELYNQGVRAFVTDKLPITHLEMTGAGFIVVNDVLRALQKLAACHREKFNGPVVAITGSNGKTILKEWIYQSVQTDKNLVRSPKSYNSQIGVPLSVWQIEPYHDMAIIEAGISLPGEMEKLARVIQPDIGIITNIGEPHQENFTDYRQKCVEKLKLFFQSKKIVFCADQLIIAEELQKSEFAQIEKFSWSRKENSNVWLKSVQIDSEKSVLECVYNRKSFELELPFTDEASIENGMLLVTFLLMLGYTPDTIKARIKILTPVAMRLELKQGINRCTLINDTYNSDLGSLTIALDYLDHQKQHSLKTVILSDILQSGRSGEDLYQDVSNILTQKKITRFIGIGPELFKNRNLFSGNATFYSSTDEFLATFRKDFIENELILLKGSRAFEFEKILKLMEKKAHETVLEINLDALVHNLNYFRSRLKPGVKLVAMVKAFSYGSGSFEIANILQFHRVDYLAVAFADEGVALREAGITLPIMVMNPEKSSFDTIIRYKLEPEIYSFRVLNEFSEELEKTEIVNYPIHIKLDTGMHRLGFMEGEIQKLIDLLKQKSTVQVQSVFSHLAGSDEEQFDGFTSSQMEVFQKQSTRIKGAFSHKILQHILNSAGIERFPEYQFDMVRLGIGLYGISATDQDRVRNISTLKTVILQVKEVPANDTVGYSRRFKAVKNTRIGILPIGYADGLHRILGNGVGKLLVNGNFVPIIGSICMDMCMIDITGVDAGEGDEVIVFGDNYPITELARQMNTIPYEVLTSISPRVKRIYYQE